MKKVLCLCWFLSCFAFAANAGVSFLPAGSSSVGVSKKTQTITSDQKCKNENYRKTCSGKQIGVDPCPHNNKYYKYCLKINRIVQNKKKCFFVEILLIENNPYFTFIIKNICQANKNLITLKL